MQYCPMNSQFLSRSCNVSTAQGEDLTDILCLIFLYGLAQGELAVRDCRIRSCMRLGI